MLISILIPSYNGSGYIKRCLDSIFNQTYQNFMILFLDDSSTDNTENIIKNINSDKIRYLKNEKNKGRGFSRNKLLKLSETEFSVWCDIDDYMHPTKIEKQINYMLENQTNFLATEMFDCDSNGNVIGLGCNKKNDIISLTYNKILKQNCINHPTVMFKTEIAKKIGFNDIMERNEDWDFYKKLYESGLKVDCLGEPLYYYKL